MDRSLKKNERKITADRKDQVSVFRVQKTPTSHVKESLRFEIAFKMFFYNSVKPINLVRKNYFSTKHKI